MDLLYKLIKIFLILCFVIIISWVGYNKISNAEICIPVKSESEAINIVKNEISLYLPSKKVRDILFNLESYINNIDNKNNNWHVWKYKSDKSKYHVNYTSDPKSSTSFEFECDVRCGRVAGECYVLNSSSLQ